MNIKGLLLGSSSRLKNIVRYSNSHRIQDESVAEHSFSTALYCLVIGSELQAQGMKIDVDIAVKRALIHDIEESHSGDFIRTFKHSDPELSLAIDRAARSFAGTLFKEMAGPAVASHLLAMWENAKDRTLEGMLVEFADFLSVVSYVMRECSMGNRSLLEDNASTLGEYANKFNAERFEFLRAPIVEAQKMLFKEISHDPKR
ncbi:MAG: YfbR-like 5'-deoxynucleotidase [Patescibacteria group bacterium]